MPAARAQSRKAGLLSGASIPGRVQRRARVPRLSAILVVASQRSCGDPNSPRSHRTRISGGRWRAGFRAGGRARLAAALPADAQGLGYARNAQARGRRGDRPSRPMCASSAARTIRTPPSCPISCRGAIPSPSSRPAPGSSSWRSGEKAVSTRKPTCWPMSTCAAFPCRPRASWADASLRSLPARRRPTPAKPMSRPWSPRASWLCPPSPIRAGRSPPRKGRIEGGAPAAPAARTALATLYAALVTAHVLERLDAPGDLIVEGGFTRSPAFAAVLAALMPGRRVVIAPAAAGAAAGAALLAHWGGTHAPPRLEPAARLGPAGARGLPGAMGARALVRRRFAWRSSCNLPAAISFGVRARSAWSGGLYVSDFNACIRGDLDARPGAARAPAMGPFPRSGHRGAGDHLDSRRARSHARRLRRRRAEGKPGAAFRDSEVGLAGSAYLVGAVVGALFFGWLTDRLGRKKLFFTTIVVYLVATAMTGLAWNGFAFFLFRFFTGCGIGGEYSAINSTIQELVPARFRGQTRPHHQRQLLDRRGARRAGRGRARSIRR